MDNRNINIDLAKSIACLGILGLHCIGYINYSLYYICTFAVPVFFMVNGYLMFGKASISPKYVLSKILSLLRIIVFWNLIITVPVMILRHKFANPLEQIYKSLIQQGYLWHFWFFGALIILYFLLLPLHKLVNTSKHKLTIHIVLCGILFVICIANTVYSSYSLYPMAITVPQSLRLWTSLFYYLLGGLFVRIKDKAFFAKISPIPISVGVVLFGIICNYGQKHLGLYKYSLRAAELFYDEFFVILWCILVFTLLIKVNIPAGISNIVTGFSKLSLGVFILHPLFLKASEIVLIPKTTPQAVGLWGIITLLSVIASYIISKIPYVKRLIEL